MQKKYALSSFPNSAQIIIISVSTTDVIGKENDKFMLTVPIYISALHSDGNLKIVNIIL